jgi:outer membrane murein-binding lipoprotein Lpp
MKKKIFISMALTLLIIAISLSGCQIGGGVTTDEYNDLVRQLNNANSQLSQIQTEKAAMESAIESVEEDLEAAEETITQLQIRISGMTVQNDIVGDTTLETVTNIIEYYHATHIYSKTDLFVCSDMAAEVWSMLKAQGIDSLICVGDIDNSINDILLSTHAWILADIDDGQYLALESTGGYVVYKSENPLYYQGWYFDSPADMKSYNELVREYNVRVTIINQIIVEDQAVVEEHNNSSDPSEAAKLKAVHDMLEKLIDFQEADLLAIEDEINSLATRCTI